LNKYFIIAFSCLICSIATHALKSFGVELKTSFDLMPLILFLTGFILILTGFKKISEEQERRQLADSLSSFEKKYGKLSIDTTIKNSKFENKPFNISEHGYIEISQN
jgi:hypothetical protein